MSSAQAVPTERTRELTPGRHARRGRQIRHDTRIINALANLEFQKAGLRPRAKGHSHGHADADRAAWLENPAGQHTLSPRVADRGSRACGIGTCGKPAMFLM